jgi:hypothetical protein
MSDFTLLVKKLTNKTSTMIKSQILKLITTLILLFIIIIWPTTNNVLDATESFMKH